MIVAISWYILAFINFGFWVAVLLDYYHPSINAVAEVAFLGVFLVASEIALRYYKEYKELNN